MKTKYFTATRLAVIAVFSALAFALYLVRIPLAFAFAPWLEMNFSDIPALLGTFALGPISGCIIVLIKVLLKLIVQGTGSAFVGETADLLIGFALVLGSGAIYRKRRTLGGAISALVVGSLCSVALSIVANRFLLIPFYVDQIGMAGLVGALTGLFPRCTADNFYTYYLWASVLPFNALRCLAAGIITFLAYKHISRIIRRLAEKLDAPRTDQASDVKRTVLFGCLSGAVVLLLIGGVLLRHFLTK